MYIEFHNTAPALYDTKGKKNPKTATKYKNARTILQQLF